MENKTMKTQNLPQLDQMLKLKNIENKEQR